MDQLLEIWLPVKDYEGLYEVSNLGRVKSLNYHRTGEERILKGIIQHTGYLHVTLCKNNKYKQFRVHRLVAQAFILNPHNLPEVNHINENKENNAVSNLEWVSTKYNINYGTGIKRRVKKRSKNVLQLTRDGKLVKEWPSALEASKSGFSRICIYRCCKGEGQSTGGFIWKYKEQP